MKREKKSFWKYRHDFGSRQLFSEMGNIFFPSRCLLCQSLLLVKGETFCDTCCSQFQPLLPPLCRICGESLLGGEVCERCLRKPPPYSLCRSLFVYNEVMRKVIHDFKFGKDLVMLAGIKQLCGNVVPSEFSGPALVVPVPLHNSRLRRRGFNQSFLLAKLLFNKNKNVRFVPELLQRVKNTVSQSGLTKKERGQNLKNVFQVKKKTQLTGENVYVVDDVMTTGTTVSECAETLVNAGCCSVSVLTIARAEKKE